MFVKILSFHMHYGLLLVSDFSFPSYPFLQFFLAGLAKNVKTLSQLRANDACHPITIIHLIHECPFLKLTLNKRTKGSNLKLLKPEHQKVVSSCLL